MDEDNGEQVSADEIASELKMSLGRTKYLLDVLCDAAYIAASRAVGRPPLYYVERKGREVLVRRGLL